MRDVRHEENLPGIHANVDGVEVAGMHPAQEPI
jgi:hypothetical protein